MRQGRDLIFVGVVLGGALTLARGALGPQVAKPAGALETPACLADLGGRTTWSVSTNVQATRR